MGVLLYSILYLGVMLYSILYLGFALRGNEIRGRDASLKNTPRITSYTSV